MWRRGFEVSTSIRARQARISERATKKVKSANSTFSSQNELFSLWFYAFANVTNLIMTFQETFFRFRSNKGVNRRWIVGPEIDWYGSQRGKGNEEWMWEPPKRTVGEMETNFHYIIEYTLYDFCDWFRWMLNFFRTRIPVMHKIRSRSRLTADKYDGRWVPHQNDYIHRDYRKGGKLIPVRRTGICFPPF